MMSRDVVSILRDYCQRFSPEIASSARRHGYSRLYGLTRVENGIATRTPDIDVYQREDSCFITGDALDWAYDISQFTVHELVRELLDDTQYVLLYLDEDVLSESNYQTLGVEWRDD